MHHPFHEFKWWTVDYRFLISDTMGQYIAIGNRSNFFRKGVLKMTYMQINSVCRKAICLVAVLALGVAWSSAKAQDSKSAETESLAAIDADFEKEVDQASVKRLSRIAALAQKTTGEQSEDLWRTYFDSVIAEERFTEAEAHAQKLVDERKVSLDLLALAEVTTILAMAKRGALEESIASVQKFMATPIPEMEDNGEPLIPAHVRLGLTEVYLRTLVDAGRYDLALKAIDAILAGARSDEVKDYLANEKAALERVGKPVPAIKGVDVDDRPFDITKLRGKPVLVLFWASWDEVSESQLESDIALTEAYKEKGLEVVAINVDKLREDVEPNEDLAVNVRRFLIERNLLWKCLISDSDDKDYASQLGVRYLPANLVIDANGIIRHVDRSPSGLAKALADVCK